jgi:hypothetical protein
VDDDEISSRPIWSAERIDGTGRAEIHARPSGWEVRVYRGARLALRRTFPDIRDAHDTAIEALK